MKRKKLILFMPSIEGGGVEKNLFIISNFIGSKLNKTSLITASKSFNYRLNHYVNLEDTLSCFIFHSDFLSFFSIKRTAPN